jgi:hypothetical protein
VAILGLDQAIYNGLNPTGARIWELVRNPIKVSEIHRTIVEEFDVDEETARNDLLDVLTQHQHAALIEVRRSSTAGTGRWTPRAPASNRRRCHEAWAKPTT